MLPPEPEKAYQVLCVPSCGGRWKNLSFTFDEMSGMPLTTLKFVLIQCALESLYSVCPTLWSTCIFTPPMC